MDLQKLTPPLSWIFDAKKWWIFHILFWLFIYLDEVLSLFGITSSMGNYLYLIPTITADILLVYFNIYYLVPKFLLKNRFWEYAGISAITLIINVLISVLDFEQPYDFSNPEDVSIYIDSFTASFITTGTILVAAVGIKFFKGYILDQERLIELETANLRTELDFLKNQINPHFLFNSLNNIYVQSRKRPKEASESILLLSDLLRYQLYDCSKEKVLLKNEIDYLKNYLEMDKMRKLDVEIDFRIDGQPNGTMVAPFIFVPFVENAVKHGNAVEGKSFLNVYFKIETNQLHFSIENSKPLLPNEREVGGIGLKNVKRRLELLYPQKHQLNVDDKKNSYKVDLTLNLN